MPKKSKADTFESQLSQLESIIETMEKGELPLDEALTFFEKGVGLTRQCQKLLDEAQQKVKVLSDEHDQLKNFEWESDDI